MEYADKTLILIRHGELPDSCRGRYIGRSDVSLSEQGLRDCRNLAARFSELRPEKIFVSPMRRARESACAICPDRDDLIFDDRLREIDFGDWENLSFEEIRLRTPQEELDRWFRHPDRMRFPNGDSVAEHYAGVDAFLDEVLFSIPEKTIAVITHGGVLMRLISRARQLPPERQFEVLPERASMTILQWRKDGGFLNGE